MTYTFTLLWRGLLVSSVVVVLMGLRPPPAHADAPFHDPDFVVPQGGGPTTTTAATGDPVQAAPPTVPVLTPPLIPSTDDDPGGDGGGRNPNEPLDWLDMAFNPGKWLLDSVMGALAAVVNSLAGLCKAFGLWALGLEPPDGAAVAQTGLTAWTDPATAVTATSSSLPWPIHGEDFILATPRAYTMEFTYTQQAHQIFFEASIILIIFISSLRGLRLLADPSRAAIIHFVFTLLGAICLTAGSELICGLAIDLANALSTRIKEDLAGLALEALLWAVVATGPGLALVGAFVQLYFWAQVLRLGFHAFGRLALVNLFIIVGPVAGVAHISGTWNYARVWFFRFLELILTPVIWAMLIGVMGGFIHSAMQGEEPILAMLLAGYIFGKIPELSTELGLAAREAVAQINITSIVSAATTLAKLV